MPADLLTQIRAQIDFATFFSQFTELRGSGAERQAFCVFHDNTATPSMSINVQTGVYNCHNPACGSHGDFVHYFMRVRNVVFREAIREIARTLGIATDDTPSATTGVIDASVAQTFHDTLIQQPALLTYLRERRGLSDATLIRYKVGHDGQRYTVPITDEIGRLVNIRRYKPNANDAADKMLSWRRGYGTARLWPFDAFLDAAQQGFILLVEGEMDCLVAREHGLPAITCTGGAGTWSETWNPWFRNLDVVICYDVDDAGRRGALNVARKLQGVAHQIKIVALPLTEPPGADVTDYFIGNGLEVSDFRLLMEQTPVFGIEEAPAEPAEEVPTDVTLSRASEAQYHNKLIRTRVLVSGKATLPFVIPQNVTMTCRQPGWTMCSSCPVDRAAGRLTRPLDLEGNEALEFIKIADAVQSKLLRAKMGIPSKCPIVEAELESSVNVEELQVIPEVDALDRSEAGDDPYVTRVAYNLGHGVRPNQTYVMTARAVNDPRTQHVTYVVLKAAESQSNIDVWRSTPDTNEQLAAFEPEEDTLDGLQARLGTIYDDLELETRIFQRRDLMLATDLTFHSVLQFSLQGHMLVRGWVEALIIGDTRTGKSTTVERLLRHYRAGEFGTGENTSLAGLVGGLHQIGTTWALNWGKVPLNDRRLFVIDEAGNLPIETIARLSSMRSSGVAEIIKVHTERTNARTRQIWISNPRGNKPLGGYTHGCLAVKELIDAPEDIARFDIVCTAAADDVSLSVVNATRLANHPRTFTSDLCHQRVMWAWSRRGHQVQWAPGAEVLLLDYATQHGLQYQYATEIPIVERNEQRVKLARIAVSAAAMFHSCDETGELIVVKPCHVEFAFTFLNQTYGKASLGYTAYAENKRRQNEVRGADLVLQILNRRQGSMQLLMESEVFTQTDLQEILGLGDRNDVRTTLTQLRDSGMLVRSGPTYYSKTPAAIRFLSHLMRQEQAGTPVQAAGATAAAASDEPDF